MDEHPSHRHQFVQIWLLLAGTVAFALYVVVDRSYLQTMFAADQSYLTMVILAMFLGASCHAAWFILKTSSCIEQGMAAARADAGFFAPDEGEAPGGARGFVQAYVRDLTGEREARASADAGTSYILEVYADRLRGPVELGWYMVDILIRLGLIGTIIGFILILSALADGPAPTGENIQALLISMSGGMGTALYTTLAGLITGTLLGVQYAVLSRGVERLISLLIEIRNRSLSVGAA